MGQTREANLILKRYKLPNGACNYPELFKIPTWERLPALAQLDYRRLNMLIIGAITIAFEAMNLKRGMNELQILALSELIIDSSSEDNLTLEDVILFLQFMISGKYDLSYESMDIPKFMRFFEIYREERHRAVVLIRENEHLQYKALGDANRTSQSDPISEHFATFGDRISQLKDQIQYERNIHLKDIDKF